MDFDEDCAKCNIFIDKKELNNNLAKNKCPTDNACPQSWMHTYNNSSIVYDCQKKNDKCVCIPALCYPKGFPNGPRIFL
jgi:hypothetical protein